MMPDWETIFDSTYALQYARQSVNGTDFTNTSKVHDWKNYVPQALVNVWGQLGIDARLAIYLIAEENAMSEAWE